MELLDFVFLLPDVFISLIIFVGLLLQRRRFSEILSGTVKTLLGYHFILFGGKVIAESSYPLAQMFSAGFNLSGVVVNVEAATGVVLNAYGFDVALIMCAGLAVNLLLAKISRWHYVFATGHQALYMACVLVMILRGFGSEGVWLYLLGALALGCLMTLSPALVQRYTVKICRNDRIALGHFGSFAYFVSAFLGELWGKSDKSAEDLKIPAWLGFIRDTPVMLFLTVASIDIFAASMSPKFVEQNLSSGQSWLIYSMGLAIQFTIGFVIISTGIRWIVDEIVPAVRGIARAWIKGAIPTVDCPLVFPYAPNSLVIGFLSSFLAGVISMFMMMACGLPVILPSAVPHFFCGATAGIYGNVTGGVRGAIVGGLMNGVLISFLPLLAMPALKNLTQSGVAFADADFNLAAILLNSWLERSGEGGVLVILLGIILLSILIPASLEDRDKDTPWFMQK